MTKTRGVGSTIATGALVLASMGFCGVANAAPDNYGGCVSTGIADTSTSRLGPINGQSLSSSGKIPGALNGHEQSGGQSRFSGAEGCPHVSDK
jgi:hypothetical protein